MAPSLLLESKNLEKNPERGNLAQKARVENPGSRNPEPELAPEVRAANLAKLRALVGLPSGQ
jgi:hypothetical protein